MSIFLILGLVVATLIVLLRLKRSLGFSVLCSGLLIWLLLKPEPHLLVDGVVSMLQRSRTYDLVGSLYFVVCLEIELRQSGCLDGMVKYLQQLTSSKKLSMAIMAAFLGLLPSIGGARFSAPIVKQIAQGEAISCDRLSAVNFWFRHICEFASPIVPGIILACSVAGIPVIDLICHLAWLTPAAFVIGWIVLYHNVTLNEEKRIEISDAQKRKERFDFLLSFTPILIALVLMMTFKLSAWAALGITVLATGLLLKLCRRPVQIADVLIRAVEWRLFRDVFCIFFFMELLESTGLLQALVANVTQSAMPLEWVIAVLSFMVGILTGITQGQVAVVVPIVAAAAPGNLEMLSIAMVCGLGGQMLTPTHMCLTISLDYFKGDFFKTVGLCAICEALLLAAYGISVWLFPIH